MYNTAIDSTIPPHPFILVELLYIGKRQSCENARQTCQLPAVNIHEKS